MTSDSIIQFDSIIFHKMLNTVYLHRTLISPIQRSTQQCTGIIFALNGTEHLVNFERSEDLSNFNMPVFGSENLRIT